MDMNINRHFLRQERENRAWTQSQLAEVADLSLRTVQRIEQTGVASKESAMALAAVLEVSLTELCQSPSITKDRITFGKPWSAGLGLLLAGFISLGWWSSAAAEQVMMKLSITSSLGDRSDMQMLTDLGQQGEIRLESQLRLLVTPSRQGEHLLLSTQVYDYFDDDYHLIGSPAILVADHEPAEIHFNTTSSGRVELRFDVDY